MWSVSCVTACCWRDGSLAVTQPLGSRKLLRFHRCLKGWRQLTPASSQHGMLVPVWEGIRLHLAGHVHACFSSSGVDKEGSCPTSCATSPMVVGRDRSFRTWNVYQNRGPRWVGPHVPNAPQWSQNRSAARFQNCARSAKTRQVQKRSAVSQDTTKAASLSRAHPETNWKHSRNVSRCC